MTMPSLTTRLSLGWRMVVALSMLSVVAVGVGMTAVAVTGLLAWVAMLAVAFLLGVLYVPVFSEAAFALYRLLSEQLLLVVISCGTLSVPYLYLRPVRADIRQFRSELGTTGTPATERHPEIAEIAQRLAQQADIAPPDVYIVNRRRPESYAIGTRTSGTILLTRGLIRPLSDEELRAVIAHETSHLANGDSRVLGLALVPLLLAEDLKPDPLMAYMEAPDDSTLGRRLIVLGNMLTLYTPLSVGWVLLLLSTTLLELCSQLGLTVLSRGREFAADRSAAQLTGSPSALASALKTLDGARGTPTEDARTWKRSASALDVLPPADSTWSWGPFRTHPSTQARIDRLEAMAAEKPARTT
jgi:heat shock protein HtpX